MTMTPLTSLNRTDPDFKERTDTFFAADLPLFVTEANALQVDVNAKQVIATSAATTATTKAGEALDSANAATASLTASQGARDSAIAARDTALTHANDASDFADAAEASALIAAGGAAFSDANYMFKGRTDPTKHGRFDVETNVPTGTEVTLLFPGSNGTVARIEDIPEVNFPIGSLAISNTPPDSDWLRANGQQVLLADYPGIPAELDNFATYSAVAGANVTFSFSSKGATINSPLGASAGFTPSSDNTQMWNHTNFTSHAGVSAAAACPAANTWMHGAATTARWHCYADNSVSGTSYLAYSTDGSNWTVANSILGAILAVQSACAANNLFFVNYSVTGPIYRMAYGATHAAHTVISAYPSKATVPTTYVSKFGNTVIAYSGGDQSTFWAPQADGSFNRLGDSVLGTGGMAFGKSGADCVAITTGVTTAPSQKSSDGGITWTAGGATSASSNLTGGSALVKVGAVWVGNPDNGNAITSTDNGATWVDVTGFDAMASGPAMPIEIASKLYWFKDSAQGKFFDTVDGVTFNKTRRAPMGAGATFANAAGTIASNGVGVIVVAGSTYGHYMRSADHGVTWNVHTLSEVTAAVQHWVGFANGRFFITKQGSTALMHSADGITWTAATLGHTPGAAQTVVYGAGVYVCMGSLNGGSAYSTSTDLVTWTNRTATWTGGQSSIAFTGGVFVATSLIASANIFTSANGTAWSNVANPHGNTAVRVLASDTSFICALQSNTTTIYTSSNGTAWGSAALPNSDAPLAAFYTGGKHYIVSQTRLFSTTNFASIALDWTPSDGFHLLGEFNAANVFTGTHIVSWTASGASALCRFALLSNIPLDAYSRVWTPSIYGTRAFNSAKAVFIDDSGKGGVVTSDFLNYQVIKPLVANGRTFTSVSTPGSATAWDGTYFWLALLGSNTNAYRSTDGLVWEAVATNTMFGPSTSLSGVQSIVSAWDATNGRFYSTNLYDLNNVRRFGYLKDGQVTFKHENARAMNPATQWQRRIVYFASRYYVALSGGWYMSSADLATWKFHHTNLILIGGNKTNFALFNGKILMYDTENVAGNTQYLYSQDGINWTAGQFPCAPYSALLPYQQYAVLGVTSTFMAMIDTSDRLGYFTTTDGVAWSARRVFADGIARASFAQPGDVSTPQPSLVALDHEGTSPFIVAIVSKSNTVATMPSIEDNLGYTTFIKVQ